MKIYEKTLPYAMTDLCVELVAPYVKNFDTSVYVFCESRSTLAYESAIAERFGGTFAVNVTTFSRYVSSKGGNAEHIPPSSSALVIAKTMIEKRNELIKLKNFSASTAAGVYELIAQLKAAKVTPEDLESIVEKESGVFSFKLKDVALLFAEYERFLKERGLVDDGAMLAKMPALIDSDDELKGKKVIIAGIGNFTAQTLDVVLALEKNCDLDCVILSYDGASAVNETKKKLLSVSPKAEVIPDASIYPPAVVNIKERLYAPEKLSEKGMDSDVVEIYETADVYEEARFIAATVKENVLNNNRRYRDFCVACPDVEGYLPIVKKAFADHGVGIFADKKDTLKKHPIVKAFSSLVELKRLNQRTDVALEFIKNPVAFSFEEGEIFETYVNENALTRYSLSRPFKDEAAESVRKKAAACKDKIPDNGTIARLIDAVKTVFDDLRVKDNLDKLIEDLDLVNEGVSAEYVKRGYDEFINLLDGMKELLGEEKVGLKEFKELVLSSCAACEISLLPRYNDAVFFGDYKSAGIRRSDILFCMGMTSGTPFIKGDNSLFNDRDLDRLERLKVVVEPKISIVNKRERECVATTLMSFKDKLYVTYPQSGLDGERTGRSQTVDYLVAAFTGKNGSPLFSLAVVDALRKKQTAKDYISLGAGIGNYYDALERFRERKTDDLSAAKAFLNAVNKIAPDLCPAEDEGKGATGVKFSGNLSSSMIEKYFSCPYRAFGNSVLNLKDPKSGEIKSFEFGNLIHKTFEDFAPACENIEEEGEALAVAGEIFDRALSSSDLCRAANDAGNGFIVGEVKKEAMKECARLFRLQKRSAFKVLGTEIPFGKGKDGFPAVEIAFDGEKRKMSGIIDRVDVYRGEEGEYAHVIDYKTGRDVAGNIDEKKTFCGEKIQLYLYLNAVAAKGYKAAGAHYLALNDDYDDKGDEKKMFFGNVISNRQIMEKLDGKLADEGKSEEYGLGGRARTGFISEEQLKDYMDYSLFISEECAKEMAQGNFTPSPTRSACSYCRLKGACGFDNDDRTNLREDVEIADGSVSEAARRERERRNG